MFLMPSLYEPCGLGQLISYKYGTVPIVRRTGGLADTVQDGRYRFCFRGIFSSKALHDAIKRAIEAFNDAKRWKSIVLRDMGLDFSWDSSAKKYVELYGKAVGQGPQSGDLKVKGRLK